MEQTHSLDSLGASQNYDTTIVHNIHNSPFPTQNAPSQHQHLQHQPISMSTCMYGDVLRRMMTFLNCSSINECGKMNRAWTQMILSKNKQIPWINIKTSLLVDDCIRKILFDSKNGPALIDHKQYLQLVTIEIQQSTPDSPATIFPSPHIRRFCLSHQEPPSTIENVVALMPNLRTLVIGESVTAAELTHLSGLTALEYLELQNCSQITDKGLASLNHITTLKTLHMYGCSQITQLNLKKLIELQSLCFDVGPQTTHINLEPFTRLEQLLIHHNSPPDLIDSSLTQLSKLTQLKDLYLNGANSASLNRLKSLTRLEKLSLHSCLLITSIGLKHISHLTALQTLHLTETQINDVDLSVLKGCTALRHLSLDTCLKITDSGLINLSHFTLHTLALARCPQITDIGLDNLKGLAASLEFLDLTESGITDVSLSYLRIFTRLRRLNLHQCVQLTGAGLIHLQALTALRTLILNRCPQIDDTGILNLSTLTALRLLGLSKCPVTGNGLRSLQDHLPDLKMIPAPPPKAPE